MIIEPLENLATKKKSRHVNLCSLDSSMAEIWKKMDSMKGI